MIPRGVDSSTTFSEQDLIRAATPSGSVVMTDGPAVNSPPVVRQHRPVAVRTSTGNGPRLPQRRYPSVSTSPTRRVEGNSLLLTGGGRRSPSSIAPNRRAPERADSGLGLDIVDEKRPAVVQQPARRRFLARGIPDSDDEVETDRGTTSVVTGGQTSRVMPFHPSKSAPEATTNYSTTMITPPYTQRPEMMDTTPSPNPILAQHYSSSSLNSFDSERYQKHLLEIQHKAIEQDRLQQGLLLLLPNNDGDT